MTLSVKEIIRLRQLMALQLFGISEQEQTDHLANERKNYIDKATRMASENWNLDLQNGIIKHSTELNNLELPTDLQSPASFQSLKKMLQKSIDAAHPDEPKPNYPIIIASVFGDEINGYCFKSGEEIGIIIDDTLFTFCHLISKIISQVVFVEGKDGVIFNSLDVLTSKRLIENEDNYNRLIDIVKAYIVRGNPSKAKQYLLHNPAYSRVSSLLTQSMELFVVAHEYGHILGKDFDNKWMTFRSDLDSLLERVDDMMVFEYRHVRELWADKYALYVAFSKYDPLNRITTINTIGPLLFFRAIDFLEHCLFHAYTGGRLEASFNSEVNYHTLKAKIPSTHPSSLVRLSFLKTSINEEVQSDHIKAFINSFDNIVEHAFSLAYDKWKSNFNEGEISIHPRWAYLNEQFQLFSLFAKMENKPKE